MVDAYEFECPNCNSGNLAAIQTGVEVRRKIVRVEATGRMQAGITLPSRGHPSDVLIIPPIQAPLGREAEEYDEREYDNSYEPNPRVSSTYSFGCFNCGHRIENITDSYELFDFLVKVKRHDPTVADYTIWRKDFELKKRLEQLKQKREQKDAKKSIAPSKIKKKKKSPRPIKKKVTKTRRKPRKNPRSS